MQLAPLSLEGLQSPVKVPTSGDWLTDENVFKNTLVEKEGESTQTLLPKHSLPSQSTSRVAPWYAPSKKTKQNTNKNFSQMGSKQSRPLLTLRKQSGGWTWSSVLFVYSLLQTQLRKILVKQPEVTLKVHRSLEKETQRHRGVQSAEQRCNLSSKMSGLFLPVVLSAVRVVPLAFKTEGRGNTQ